MSEILLERSASGVATITLNRPQRKNAVGAGMNLALGCDLVVAGESFGLVNRVVPDAEAAAQSVNLVSEDTKERVRAFLEKRKPSFHGR